MSNTQKKNTTSSGSIDSTNTTSTPPLGPGFATPEVARPAPSSFSSVASAESRGMSGKAEKVRQRKLKALRATQLKLEVLRALLEAARAKNAAERNRIDDSTAKTSVALDFGSVIAKWDLMIRAEAKTRGERQVVNGFIRRLSIAGLLRAVWEGDTAQFMESRSSGDELNIGPVAKGPKRVVGGSGRVWYTWRTPKDRRPL